MLHSVFTAHIIFEEAFIVATPGIACLAGRCVISAFVTRADPNTPMCACAIRIAWRAREASRIIVEKSHHDLMHIVRGSPWAKIARCIRPATHVVIIKDPTTKSARSAECRCSYAPAVVNSDIAVVIRRRTPCRHVGSIACSMPRITRTVWRSHTLRKTTTHGEQSRAHEH